MNHYILSMGCVDGSSVQGAFHTREDLLRWLKRLDHEGSSWSVVVHDMDGDIVMETHDITDEIRKEYEQ